MFQFNKWALLLAVSLPMTLLAREGSPLKVVATDESDEELAARAAAKAASTDGTYEEEKDDTIVVTAAPLPKYRVASNDAGVLIDLPPEKAPFTVDTLTEDFIRERNVTDLDQLISLQPGVYQGGKTMMSRNAGTYTIRGLGCNEVSLGGVPLEGGAAMFMDPSLLERVDIVKGPIGAYGAHTTSSDVGGAGGSILLTPKRASFEENFHDFMFRGSYSKASGSRLKFVADINRVNETKDGAARIPFTYEWRNPGWAPKGARHGTMYSIAPSLSWRLSDRLTAGLDLFYQYSDQPAYQGIRTSYGKPLGTGWDGTYTEADDRMKFKTFGGTFRLDGELTDWLQSRTRVSYYQTFTDYNYRGPYSNDGFNTPYTPSRADTPAQQAAHKLYNPNNIYEWATGDRIARNFYFGQDFIFSFDVGDATHTFLTGVNVFHKRNSGRGTFTAHGPVDLATLDPDKTQQIKWGFQEQYTFEWKGLTLLAGLRTDWHDSVNHEHAWTYSPRFGISYDILEEGRAFIYANASILKDPNFNYKDADFKNAKTPVYLSNTWEAIQKEIGIRVNPVGSLWASISVFDIDQNNAPMEFPQKSGYYISEGKKSSKGLEFTLSGNLTDNWSVYAAYAYSYYEDRNKNQHFDRYPPHAISLWTSYKASWCYDAVFGFGARWRDDWLMTFRGNPLEKNPESQCAKSLLTFDASVDVPITDEISLGLSLKNIFNKRGIESARNLQAFANDGRTIELFVRGTF